jgi:hypothetical protein
MFRLPELKRKHATALQQLVPRCANPDCPSAASRWSSVLHRTSGFWFNEQGWFCGSRCLEVALEEQLLESFAADRRPAPIRTTMPLGLMMLSRGIVSDPQLRDAIRLQHSSGDRIGACMQRLGFISYEDIASAVATQWGCPIFPAESVQPACATLVPYSLAERYRMLPVHLVGQGRRLFVGFSDRVNHTALIAIEHMLGCETEACIIPEPKLLQLLDYRKRDTTGEAAVSRPNTSSETARMILSYAQQTSAHAIRLRAVESNIWVRFLATRSHLDLVFEV